MKHDPTQLRSLLEEVTPADGAHCGPGRAAVLDLVRQERSRRVRRRRTLAAGAFLLIAAGVAARLLWQPAPPAAAGVAHTQAQAYLQTQSPMAPMPPAVQDIRQVDDQQLLDLLQGTPAALMEWPNGERTLLVWGR